VYGWCCCRLGDRGLYFDEPVAVKKLQSARCDPDTFAVFFRWAMIFCTLCSTLWA
jgi:hypothetical protein